MVRRAPDVRAGLQTPVGPVWVEGTDAVTAVGWGEAPPASGDLLSEATAQIGAYFAGTRESFDLPLDLGTGFRARFRQALVDIPYGQTRTYGELARDLGVSAQAVGQACGANPLPILVPCHRVLGTGGLGGFSGGTGVETKVWLLKHEGGTLLI